MTLTMTQTSPACPVQYEGTIEDKSFYFRARWDQWTFALADSLEEAVDLACCDLSAVTDWEGIFARTGRYGDDEARDFAASWMPHEEAERLIRLCAQEYLERKT